MPIVIQKLILCSRYFALNLTLLASFFLGIAFKLPAQEGVVGRKAADGHFSFQPVEELLINQSRKVKVATGDQKLNAVDAKKLERVEISHVGPLAGDGKGAIYHVEGDSRQRILPENFNTKEGIDLTRADIPLTISVVKNKKTKDVVTIPAAEFYVYLPQADADQALQFVMDKRHFATFDEQLNGIEGFVSSFSQSSTVQDLRRGLRVKLQAGIGSFDEGASFQTILDAQKLSVLADKAFPADSDITTESTQIDQRIQNTIATCQLLRSLAALEDWTSFLVAYEKIEIHQDSFPDLMALHHAALEEQTRLQSIRGRALTAKHKDADAAREFGEALRIDPRNVEIEKEMQAAQMLAAQAEAKLKAGSWKPLPKDSPQERLFRQALYNADRALQDKDYQKAKDAIQQAERENADAPDILLAKASLLAAGDQIASALPLVDRYDSLVTDSADREKGDAVKNQVLYELRKRQEASRKDIDAYLGKGEIAHVYKAATEALKLDQTEPAFLFPAALSASVLNKRDEAKDFAIAYLKYSDNLEADEVERGKARRLLKSLQTPSVTEPAGTANWFSGRHVPNGAFYCPASLAFQPHIEDVAGFKFRMTYSWEKDRLTAIRTDFEDEKGRLDYSGLVYSGAAGEKKSESEPGTFSFVYGQTRSAVRFAINGPTPKDLKASDDDIRLVKNADGAVHLLNAAGLPQIVVENDPLLDTEVVRQVMGPVATVVSGNSYFNPFIWDGLHYFTVTYDNQGRMLTAKEWNTANTVRFDWDNQRLTGITMYRGNEGEAVYSRKITYSGPNISEEDYTAGGHGGHIKYSYSKDHLTSAKVEDHGVHDGKTWVVRFE